MDAFLVAIQSVWTDSGYVALNMGNITMIVVGLILLYLAIGKGYEPLLLTPIAFGCVLANFPNWFPRRCYVGYWSRYSDGNFPTTYLFRCRCND